MNETVIAFKSIGVILSEHVAAERTPIRPAYARGCQGKAEGSRKLPSLRSLGHGLD